MRELLRKHARYFLLATLAGLALRMLFIFRFPSITTDSFIYGDIAKNWLRHGIYGITDSGAIVPTDIRLPGYPGFLALVFALFGMEHYRAVLFIQMFVDIGTCLLIADLTRRVVSPRAARAAFLLAALCPFLANYVATALTETLEVFFTVLALDLAIVGLEQTASLKLRPWIGCGLAVGSATLLRPDGGVLLISLLAYLMFAGVSRLRQARAGVHVPHLLRMGVLVTLLALAPLAPWTARNLRTMHRFRPLAPRYANEENEFVPMGFNRWTRTWIADYASVEEIYWQVPGNPVDAEKLPDRAFDSPSQREQTLQLIEDYNQELHVSPALDHRFETLAAERIAQAPLRYYAWLPALRIADMWLRPRTELLPSDTRWWEFNDDPEWSVLAVGLGIINLGYLMAALAGKIRRPMLAGVGLLGVFLILRSLLLATLENPEPRYTLECYPVVIVLAAASLSPRSDS